MLFLFTGACSAPAGPVSLSPPPSQYRAKDYGRLLRRWTRHGRIIKQLDTPLKVHATFISPDYRGAYLARYAHIFRLPSAERLALEQSMRQAWSEGYPFTFAAATHDLTYNDFDRKRTIWRVTLVNDAGRQVRPRTVERERRITPLIRSFYPYVGEFSQVYQVTFPKRLADGGPLVNSRTKRLTLRFAGPLGQVALHWDLR